jgi:hypothetical protein
MHTRGVRWLLLLAVIGCRSSDAPPAPAAAAAAPSAPPPAAPSAPSPAALSARPPAGHKPNDEMDERMRHCPLALDGATSTLEDIAGGVRFTIVVPAAAVPEARNRAHHIVEFAAKRTREGHGEFDGKGGGRMKNCPVVTDDVTITALDIAGGAQLDVVTAPDHVEALRAETRARAEKCPFVGATITIAAAQ